MEERDSRFPTPEMLAEISRLGKEIYETRIRALLEPEFDGQFVAIHVDTGDYEVAKNATYATRALRARVSLNGRGYVRKIGNEPDWMLIHRIERGEAFMQRLKQLEESQEPSDRIKAHQIRRNLRMPPLPLLDSTGQEQNTESTGI